MNSRVYKEPLQKINENYQRIDSILKQLENSINKRVKDNKIEMTKLISKLDALSPLKTLIRGYSITEYNGKVIKSKKDLVKDMEVDLKFHDGDAKAKIL